MAISITEAQELLGEYICKVSDEIFTKMVTGSEVTMSDCFTSHEGVKGKMILTELKMFGELKKWNKAHEPKPIGEFLPKEIEVFAGKCDWSICPQKYEKSYTGMMRKKGQTGMDWPWSAYVIDQVLKHIQKGIDTALWQAVKNPSAPADADFVECFDGWLQQVTNGVTDGIIENVVVTGTSMVDTIESMFDALPDAYKNAEICVHVNCSTYNQYFRDYRERFGKYCCGTSENGYEGLTLDLGTRNIKLHSWSGMGDFDGIIMAPKGALHYAYDAIEDTEIIQMQQDKRELCMWTDFKWGTQIQLEECFVVNDAFLGGK